MWRRVFVLQILIIFFLHQHQASSSSSATYPPLMRALNRIKDVKKTFCSSGDIKLSTRHKKQSTVIDLQSCDNQHDVISYKLPKILADSPNCFVLVIRSNTTDNNFQTRMKDVLEEEAARPMIVNFYNTIERTENFYVIDKSKTRRKTNKTLEYAMNFIETVVSSVDYKMDRQNRSELIKKAMTNGCTLCINFAQLIDYRYIWFLKIHEDQIDDLKCDYDCFKALLNQPYDFDFSSSYEDLYEFIFSFYIDQLRDDSATAINENYTLNDFIADNDIKMDMEGLTALAWKEQEFQVFEFLIRLDLPFPLNFIHDKKYASPEIESLETYMEELSSFHRHIRKGNFKRVKHFLTQNPHLVFARNLDNKSALKEAFDANEFEIFSYLKSQGMSFMDIKEVGEYYNVKRQYQDKKKKQLRQFNMKFVKPALKLDLMTQLMTKSSYTFDHHAQKEDDIQKAIKSAYEAIETTTREILEIAAASKDLKIFFDFSHPNLIEFDPFSDNAYGSAYNYYDFVLIAAKDLLSDDVEKKNYAIGTVAHELFHYTIHLMYQNNICPYDEKDYERRSIFVNIYDKYREIKEEEALISSAYKDEYDEEHYGELVARVPDIIYTYKHNETYLEEVMETFKDLFKFYDQYILADMREFIPTMDTREKVREINDWLDLVAEIQSYELKNEEATDTDDNDGSDDDEDSENEIDDNKNDTKKKGKVEEYEEDLPEVTAIVDFLKEDTDQRLKVFTTSNPKLILQKLYFKLRKSKTIAIYADSSYSYYGNFQQVMYQLDLIHPSVPLIINCDRVRALRKFVKIMQKTTFRKVVAIADEVEFKKKIKSKTLKEWIETSKY